MRQKGGDQIVDPVGQKNTRIFFAAFLVMDLSVSGVLSLKIKLISG